MIQIGDLCTGCTACLPVCPVSVLSIEQEKAVVSDGCIDCTFCIDACPIGVISQVQVVETVSYKENRSPSEEKKLSKAELAVAKEKEEGNEK